MDYAAGLFHFTINAHDEKMIKNQYNQIPHPAQEIIWECDTNTKDDIKCNILQADGQVDTEPIPCRLPLGYPKKLTKRGRQTEKEKNINLNDNKSQE